MSQVIKDGRTVTSDTGLATQHTETVPRRTVRDGGWLKCCFTSTETVGFFLGTEAQDAHLDFHTAPELSGSPGRPPRLSHSS